MDIRLDTELMRTMASHASQAAQRIEESAAISLRITQHDDWNCAERDSINVFILRNRNYQTRLSEDISLFSNAVNSVAQAFMEAEIHIPNMFGRVDSVIGGGASIPVEVRTSAGAVGSLCSTLAAGIQPTNGMESYSLVGIEDTINIMDFDDIKF